jgi:hypothetical protein
MAPSPMPLISRGCPAWTNDDFTGAFPATNANNATYGGTNYWRCLTAPTGNADSGTLTQAVYLAYDLSSVQSSQRGQVLVHWDQSATTGDYDCTLTGRNANNIATTYTIDVNSGAGGGSPPGSGWATKVTVAGSHPYHSRQHLVDMTSNNWIRIRVTAITGSASNNNCALNMDIHDAHAGAGDSWLCVGDSISQRAFGYDDANGIGTIVTQQIANAFPAYFPVWEDAGTIGYTATDVQAVFSTWLAMFPGKFVALNLGTNDANQGGALVTNFQSKMQSMITAALNQGCTVVIPTIPWLNTSSQAQTNVVTLNSVIATLIASNPGCIAGPDLYTWLHDNPGDLSSDNLHPTDPQLGQGNGYVDYRTQWVNWARNIYASGDPNVFAFDTYHFAKQA